MPISIIGIITLILLFYRCFYTRFAGEIKAFSFNLMVVLSLYTNIGSFVALGNVDLDYFLFGELQFIIICMVAERAKIGNVSLRELKGVSILFVSIIAGWIVLLLGNNLPNIVPYGITVDEVFSGEASTIKPAFSSFNIGYGLRLILFTFCMHFARDIFGNPSAVNEFKNSIKRIYSFYFCFLLFEFLLNNIVSSTLLRNIIILITNADSNSIEPVRNTFGIWGIDGFFSEPSYISIAVFYIMIVYRDGLSERKEWFSFILCGIALLCSLSSSGILLLVFWIVVLIKEANCKKSKRRSRLIVSISVLSLILGNVMLFNIGGIRRILIRYMDTAWIKINAFIYGSDIGNSVYTSGAIRKLGNEICYSAFFRSPFFGIGLGTTRGYGIITGMLACLGILGSISYLYYMKMMMKLKFSFRRDWLLSCFIVLYLSVFFSVDYISYPAIILVFLPFTQVYTKTYIKQVSSVQKLPGNAQIL